VLRASLTPTPPNLAYVRKIWAMMLPSLPSAAERPWQVQRYFVGKTSADMAKVDVLGPSVVVLDYMRFYMDLVVFESDVPKLKNRLQAP
jgi:hypothetical protein